MSTPPKYFKRQSGEMQIVTDELEQLIREANEVLQTVRTTRPPPAVGDGPVEAIPTAPPPPLALPPLEEEHELTEEEASSSYSIIVPQKP